SGDRLTLHTFPTRRSSDLWIISRPTRRSGSRKRERAARAGSRRATMTTRPPRAGPNPDGEACEAGRDARQIRREGAEGRRRRIRSEEHTSELQSLAYLVCR